MRNIDLRLLEVIRELHRTGSVSHAAQNLGMSQSAVSMSLARLRKHFNDPLFVRTSQGMQTTSYAESMIAELMKATEILESAMDRRLHFDPLTSDRMFHLISTDIAQITILPMLTTRLKAIAPGVRISLRLLTAEAPRQLESGEADLAIGLIPQLGAGFCQQRLFTNQFMCAMRSNHPRIKDKLTLQQFEGESHLSVTTLGTGYEALEKALETQKIARHLGMRIPSFLGVGGLITSTDYLVIVPGGVGRILANEEDVKLLPLPFSFPSYQITQNWHERYTQDPAQQWLRGLLMSTLREPSRPAPERAVPAKARR